MEGRRVPVPIGDSGRRQEGCSTRSEKQTHKDKFTLMQTHATQARTHAHSPTRSWHSCGMFLAEDVTAAALASLPTDPPSSIRLSHSLCSASLRSPKPRGLCPGHWGSPGPRASAGSPGSRLDVGCTSHVDWGWPPGLGSPGFRVSVLTLSQLLFLCLSLSVSAPVSLSAYARADVVKSSCENAYLSIAVAFRCLP